LGAVNGFAIASPVWQRYVKLAALSRPFTARRYITAMHFDQAPNEVEPYAEALLQAAGVPAYVREHVKNPLQFLGREPQAGIDKGNFTLSAAVSTRTEIQQ